MPLFFQKTSQLCFISCIRPTLTHKLIFFCGYLQRYLLFVKVLFMYRICDHAMIPPEKGWQRLRLSDEDVKFSTFTPGAFTLFCLNFLGCFTFYQLCLVCLIEFLSFLGVPVMVT